MVGGGGGSRGQRSNGEAELVENDSGKLFNVVYTYFADPGYKGNLDSSKEEQEVWRSCQRDIQNRQGFCKN